MKIVVDIPDEVYDRLKTLNSHGMATGATMYILNGTPLKTGHWIADVFLDECSVCGEQTLFFEDQQKNYCPSVGYTCGHEDSSAEDSA